jgi:hypothetical protein
MQPMAPERTAQVTLKDAVEVLWRAAAGKRSTFRELGVFLLFSTPAGDAWLLEITESDCVQIAREGERIDVSIDETPETIVVDWTHTFALKDRKLEVASYGEKLVTILPDAPAGAIHGAIRRIRKHHSRELLDRVHLDAEETAGLA